MNLRRQLLLVSLLTLVLPWAGCQFVRETEQALREGQQNMLEGTAQAIADSLSQFPAEFLAAGTDGTHREDQLYAHPITTQPLIDGYLDEWDIDPAAFRTLRGVHGENRYVLADGGSFVYLGVEVRDDAIVYAEPNDVTRADRIELLSSDAEGRQERIVFVAEAPGALLGRRMTGATASNDGRLQGHWSVIAGGYRLEARVPRQLIGDYLGLSIVDAGGDRLVQSATYAGSQPGRLITVSPVLTSAVEPYAQNDLRLIVTDRAGWRLATAGRLSTGSNRGSSGTDSWMRLAYSTMLEPGESARFADPHPSGRERQNYVNRALQGQADGSWFRAADTGRAVVAVARPVWSGSVQTGALILQQGTDSILSLTNASLARLINFTLIASIAVAVVLLGYASLLSLRVRRLSAAAEHALDNDAELAPLPSATARDEIGDLSRSFADVLQQLRSYNDYLRTLASKLSHELRTPLTIVSSSLDNLEHEPLDDAAEQYARRAREGTERLKKILDAMSEANRVEALMQNVDAEVFDLHRAVETAVAGYRTAWSQRGFRIDSEADDMRLHGSPELIVQLLDKLVDNAVEFSSDGDDIVIALSAEGDRLRLSVYNPGPPLPEAMRQQLFDSMVSVRKNANDKHLGLGLYIARIVAEGHGGNISATNIDDGVVFTVGLPRNVT